MPHRAARFGRSKIRFYLGILAVLVVTGLVSRILDPVLGLEVGTIAGVGMFLLMIWGCIWGVRIALSDHKVQGYEELDDSGGPYEPIDFGADAGDGGD